jgi:hypothetical protein
MSDTPLHKDFQEENLSDGRMGFAVSKRLQNFQLLATTAIAIGSFFLSAKVDSTNSEIAKARHQLDQITTRFEKNKKFSDEISKTIDDLSVGKPIKAKMTLVRLYTFAEDPKEKYILVNLASVTDRAELIETVAALLEGDNPQGLKADVLKQYPMLAAAKARIARKVDRDSPIAQQELTITQANSPSPPVKPLVRAEANLLSQLTPENLTGWIFIGREKAETKQFESDVISPSKTIPAKNQEVALIQGMNIRLKRPPQSYSQRSLPQLVGSLRKGSTIKILDTSRVLAETGQVGVWARIEVIKKA